MKVERIAYPLSDDVRTAVPVEGQSVAIGDFDGVHLGHRQVIGSCLRAARTNGWRASVMTFHPHPREVLGSPAYSTYLTPLGRKLDNFRTLGVDTVYIVAFDMKLAALAPSQFVDSVLKPLSVKHASVGFNFTFGHRGSGNPLSLKRFGAGAFEVTIVDPFLVRGERVSSTLIREALSFGDVVRAAALLGRSYAVSGSVVRGEGRGTTIGVPTANVSVSEPYVAPANGVYAVTATVESGTFAGTTRRGVMNVGVKPTFHSRLPAPAWEVHLFDFDGTLYGERLSVQFVRRIRDERKFDSVQALVAQIRRDIEEAGSCDSADVVETPFYFNGQL